MNLPLPGLCRLLIELARPPRLPLAARCVAVWVFGALAACTTSAAAQTEEEEYVPDLPGLICTYSSAGQTVTRIEPRLAMALDAGQSPHPQIAAEGFTARWRGRVNVLRPGTYRFGAELVGRFKLIVAGHALLDIADDGSPSPARHVSPAVELPFGEAQIEAHFERLPASSAHLRLFWQREGDFWEVLVPGALGHPAADVNPELQRWDQIERGRRLVAESRCTRCHAANDDQLAALALPVDQAADLTRLGERIHPAWLYHWLAAPHALRPQTSMPALFGNTADDRIDLYAAVQYLTASAEPALSAPLPAADGAAPPRSFAAIGCIACHAAPEEKVEPGSTLRPLAGIGSKLPRQALRQRIHQPRAHHPDSRMPDFGLAADSPLLNELTAYLAGSRIPAWESLPEAPDAADLQRRWKQLGNQDDAAASWTALGRAVVTSRGCLACHPLEGEPAFQSSNAASLSNVLKPNTPPGGCLAQSATRACADYRFAPEAREAIVAFLTQALPQPAASAPVFTAEAELDRLRCTHCHVRSGRGGEFAERILSFVELGTDQTIRDLAPPELTGIGEKLHLEAIRQVIVSDTRARPWMELKMPTYDRRQVQRLPEALVQADGRHPPAAEAAQPPEPEFLRRTTIDRDELERVGRLLVGRTGMNCVSCHDLRGIPSTGTRGPDLAFVARRVTPEWFERWMLDPQRITPGTRMPTVFFGGNSAAPQYLGGNPEAQLAALWSYLALGEEMPLPVMPLGPGALVEGGENPRLPLGDRPVLARGFMPGVAGLRGIALGTPDRVHLAFDSQQCRLAAAWSGEFVEVGGWYDAGRGSAYDNATRPLADPWWRGPAAATLRLASSADPPAVRFAGCWATAQDAGFAWRAEVATGRWIDVEERLQADGDRAFVRRLQLRGEAPGEIELLLAEAPWPNGTDTRTDSAAAPRQGADGQPREFRLGSPAVVVRIDELPPGAAIQLLTATRVELPPGPPPKGKQPPPQPVERTVQALVIRLKPWTQQQGEALVSVHYALPAEVQP